MRVAQIVRTSVMLLVPILLGSGGGCGSGATGTVDRQKEEQIRESKKTAHRQIQEGSDKARAGAPPRRGPRKAARGG